MDKLIGSLFESVNLIELFGILDRELLNALGKQLVSIRFPFKTNGKGNTS